MKRRNKKRPSPAREDSKARAAGMAAATRGRARRFKDRRKEASRRACRGPVA